MKENIKELLRITRKGEFVFYDNLSPAFEGIVERGCEYQSLCYNMDKVERILRNNNIVGKEFFEACDFIKKNYHGPSTPYILSPCDIEIAENIGDI